MTAPSSDSESPAKQKTTEDLLVAASIGRADLLGNDPELRLGLNWLRLDSPHGLIRLALTIALPLLVLSFVTIMEDRFWLGDVTGQAVFVYSKDFNNYYVPAEEFEGRQVRGMSFVGDTMVWPYIIMIPFLFVLLNQALDRFENFFESTKTLLSRTWLEENRDEYNQIVSDTRAIVRSEGPWRRARWLAIGIGLFLAGLNFVNCTTHIAPYTNPKPFIQCESQREHYQPIRLEKPKKMLVQKWDVLPARNAPVEQTAAGTMSWLAARLWTLLLGYTWLPIIIYKLLNLATATYRYTSRLAEHQRALEIKPLSPDGAGGLATLASLAISLTYPIVIVGIMMAMQFVKENTPPSSYNILMFIPFVPMFFSFFFLPLMGVHRAMSAAKQEYLQEFADLFEQVHTRFLDEVHSPSLDVEEFSRLEVSMRGLTNSYERISKMPVWPFELSTLYRLVTAVLVPVLIPIVFDRLFKQFFIP